MYLSSYKQLGNATMQQRHLKSHPNNSTERFHFFELNKKKRNKQSRKFQTIPHKHFRI